MKVEQIRDLLHQFWQSASDACPLECVEAEKQQKQFEEFIDKKFKDDFSFEDASSFMMKFLAENRHKQHTTAIIKSNCAELVVGVESFDNDNYLV